MQVMGRIQNPSSGTAPFPPAHSPLPTLGKGDTQGLGIYEKRLKAGHSYYLALSKDMNESSGERSDRNGIWEMGPSNPSRNRLNGLVIWEEISSAEEAAALASLWEHSVRTSNRREGSGPSGEPAIWNKRTLEEWGIGTPFREGEAS